MAKKKRLLSRVAPEHAASAVVESWAEKVRREIGTMAGNYQTNTLEVAQNPAALAEMKAKLGTWYTHLLGVAPQIASAVRQAKETYIQAKQALRAKIAAIAR